MHFVQKSSLYRNIKAPPWWGLCEDLSTLLPCIRPSNAFDLNQIEDIGVKSEPITPMPPYLEVHFYKWQILYTNMSDVRNQ